MKYSLTIFCTFIALNIIDAQVTEYFDFASWTADVPSITHTEDYNSIPSDIDFRMTPYNGEGYIMYSREDATYDDNRNIIDADTFDANSVDNNGSTHARLFVRNQGGNPSTYVTMRFDRPATAFYAEFKDHSDLAWVRVELWDTLGMKADWHNLTDYLKSSTFANRYYGFVVDPAAIPLDSIRFVADDNTHEGEIFSMDNISIALTAPPVSPPTPSMLNFASQNELMFSDPCSCTDPLNCNINGVTYFHDTLTITPTGGTTGLTITVDGGSTIDHFYTSLPADCPSSTGMATLATGGESIPESPPGSGVYKLEYWRPSGETPVISVLETGLSTLVPASTFMPICTQAQCEVDPIPTMSEWGAITLAILMLILGLVAVKQRWQVA